MSSDPVRRGRLAGGRPAEVAAFLSSMDADRWIADADIRVDIAHLLMLDQQEIIERDASSAVMAALLEMYEHGVPETVFDDEYEDVHAGIEAGLIAASGMDKGGRLHMGRSRNDEVATCIRIRLRQALLSHMEGISSLRAALLAQAERHTQTVMPGFTHLQHAQPTTLGHYLLAYEQALSRDFERLWDAYGRVNRCPLGAAAFASTGYPIDRDMTAGLLGFSELVLNTMDAVSARDFVIEVTAACTILMSTLSRMAEEIVLWSSAFVRFVTLDDAYCSTSSIMPQKKNPDTAEILRGKSGVVAGSFTAAFTAVKGLPMSYNRDLQDVTPSLWRAVAESGACIGIATGIISTATFHPDRMREEAGRGFSTATELADVLVREFGLPFRAAHNIIGRAIRSGMITLPVLEAAAQTLSGISLVERGLTEKRILEALDVDVSVRLRSAPGGPAPKTVKQAIAIQHATLEDDWHWVRSEEKRLQAAEDTMIRDARRLVEE
ncbi:argininosuccinate lyase [Methanogenium cariaci]|jgi:argininosuccinate lyase